MFEFRQYLLLFITASIWGSGFVAQKLGMSYVSPFAFTFIRTLIGALFLVPFIVISKRFNKRNPHNSRKNNYHALLLGSIVCGFFLIVSESFQQFGLVTSDVNKTSFITSLYMIFVPIIGIFLGHKITLKTVIAVLISCIGLYLFCIKDGFVIEKGDFLVLLCALGFSGHILVISHFINKVDGVLLSCGQFFCASLMGFIMMLLDGIPSYEALYLAAPAFLYAGIMSNGIAYTLQVVGQRAVNPTIASLILSLESVMGALFGVVLLNEVMTSREITGAILMFTAIIITQITFRKKS